MKQIQPTSNELPHLLKRSIPFEESLVKIQKDQLQRGSAPPYHYYSLITFPFSVAVLPITEGGEFILIEEYRHPTGQMLLGCPGGFLDSGEDPLKAAERELLEETGAAASSFEFIGSAYPYAGFSGQKTIYVRAHHAAVQSQPKLEASEIIRTIPITPQALKEAIANGAELDGTLCTALFFHHMSPHVYTPIGFKL